MAEPQKENQPEVSSPSVEKHLFDSGTIMISSAIDAKSATITNATLFALEKANPTQPIYIFINSPGGEIHSAYAIFDTIRFIAPEVFTIITGLAASAGSLIALAAKPANRLSLPNSKFLVHQPLISGGGLGGSASDIEIHARDIIETKNHLVNLYARETGRTVDEIATALDRDNWMNAEQAKAFGLISRIISKRTELK